MHQGFKIRQTCDSLFMKEPNKIRISPVKVKSSLPSAKNNVKPLLSNPTPYALTTKEDIQKMQSKLQLIKSKVMQSPSSVKKNSSKLTLKSSQLGKQDNDNESVDLQSEQEKQINLKAKNGKYLIWKSPFSDRPPTIFFKYPKCCGIQYIENDRVRESGKVRLTYKIYGSEYRCIVNSLESNGFQQVEVGSDWNVLFDISGTHMKLLQSMVKGQKMNHFPGCWNIGRKDYMWKYLNKQRRSNPQAYNFVPTTYLFPSDFDRFQIARENANANQLWILKPTNSACGRGIKLVTKQSQVNNRPNILVSEYVANPHLINDFKYDLRIYIVVTSYDPLRIYMFEEGLTRFATYPYTTKIKDVKKRFVHLTNFSVNKHSKNFVKNSKAEKDGQGSKWSLTALKKHYKENGIDCQKLFKQIKSVIIKTCIAVQPVMLDIHSKTQEKRNCGFQIYGFDILIDSKLKPWLMEVNVCPSLSSSSPMDRRIKHTLLTDTLNLIGIQQSKKIVQKDKKSQKGSRLYNSPQKKYYSKNVGNLEHLNYSNCVQVLAPEDWNVLFESEQQFHRKGHFERIFPTKGNIEQFKNLFQFNRYNNNMLWKYLQSSRSFLDRLYL